MPAKPGHDAEPPAPRESPAKEGEAHASRLKGRAAVVIGAGSGIGRGVARGLAREGMRVMVADIDAGAADTVRDDIVEAGGRATSAAVDATDRRSLEALANQCASEHGAASVLVNTVGAIVDRPLTEATDDDWAWLVETNLMSQVRSVDAFLPQLRAADGFAHIVTTSSMGGLVSLGPAMSRGFHAGIYATVKRAVIGYTEMLRLELAREGIGVSVLCPTRVEGNLAVTSARHRPAKFGGPADAPAAAAGGAQGLVDTGLMPCDDVGPIVVRAILANRLFIFTHPDAVSLVDAQHRRLLDDAEFAAASAKE